MSALAPAKVGQYTRIFPVYAVHLTDAIAIQQAAEWIKNGGGSCSWFVSTDSLGAVRGGGNHNRLVIHTLGSPWTGILGDWVVRESSGVFKTMGASEFEATYRITEED